jgi:predicted AlkP superfamily pyrophosphatase or phosphodiesterase
MGCTFTASKYAMRSLLIIILLTVGLFSSAQKPVQTVPHPKLIVGIVVDQMRWDFLYRYYERYSNNGFKRLMNEGFNCDNAFIPYVPSYTGPGHSCIYTGSVPAIHGIIGNNWYNRDLKRNVNCTEDTSVTTVGSTSVAGKMSPVNLLASTITDELKLSNNFRSKVIGISLKDRGAILPAGYAANGAYWYDTVAGNFITSTYYMKELPGWMQEFNAKKWVDEYLKKDWNTLYPINTYVQSTADSSKYEKTISGEDNTFPHVWNPAINKFHFFRHTPYGNDILSELAKAAVMGEKLGKGSFTDFLAISFSSTDHAGHEFGPNSVEIEDMYLRLDLTLADLFRFLDKQVGKGQYTVFLTADHGVSNNAIFLNDHKIPAGYLSNTDIQKQLNVAIEAKFSVKNAISKVINYQVYFDEEKLDENNYNSIVQFTTAELLKNNRISSAIGLKNFSETLLPEKIKMMIANGYNARRSGDIQFNVKPNTYEGSSKGTSHGTTGTNDTHLPLLWYGWGIKKGKSNREVYMTDIAPTLAALLKIQMPNGCIGKVIEEVLK